VVEQARTSRPQAHNAATGREEVRNERRVSATISRRAAPRAESVSAPVHGSVPEDGGFLAPIAAALTPVDSAREAIPSALFAMTVLAIVLLAFASLSPPVRLSRAGAMLEHKRGSVAVAGAGFLVTAVATYLLL
jgi:hypothetical protein